MCCGIVRAVSSVGLAGARVWVFVEIAASEGRWRRWACLVGTHVCCFLINAIFRKRPTDAQVGFAVGQTAIEHGWRRAKTVTIHAHRSKDGVGAHHWVSIGQRTRERWRRTAQVVQIHAHRSIFCAGTQTRIAICIVTVERWRRRWRWWARWAIGARRTRSFLACRGSGIVGAIDCKGSGLCACACVAVSQAAIKRRSRWRRRRARFGLTLIIRIDAIRSILCTCAGGGITISIIARKGRWRRRGRRTCFGLAHAIGVTAIR